jgi:hypothetical protein
MSVITILSSISVSQLGSHPHFGTAFHAAIHSEYRAQKYSAKQKSMVPAKNLIARFSIFRLRTTTQNFIWNVSPSIAAEHLESFDAAIDGSPNDDERTPNRRSTLDQNQAALRS